MRKTGKLICAVLTICMLIVAAAACNKQSDVGGIPTMGGKDNSDNKKETTSSIEETPPVSTEGTTQEMPKPTGGGTGMPMPTTGGATQTPTQTTAATTQEQTTTQANTQGMPMPTSTMPVTQAPTETQEPTTQTPTETQPVTTQAPTETQPVTTQAPTETQPVTTQESTETQPVTTQAPTETQPVTQAPTQQPTTQAAEFETEQVVKNGFYVTIPKGWNCEVIFNSGASIIFDVYDPNDPNREIVMWNGITMAFDSDFSKQVWVYTAEGYGSMYANSLLDFNLCPVSSSLMAGFVLNNWEIYESYFSSKSTVALKAFSSFNVTDEDVLEGENSLYGQLGITDYNETCAYAYCTAPDGTSCEAYLYIASIYMNTGGGNNYFDSGYGFNIIGQSDYLDAHLEDLVMCAVYTGFGK